MKKLDSLAQFVDDEVEYFKNKYDKETIFSHNPTETE